MSGPHWRILLVRPVFLSCVVSISREVFSTCVYVNRNVVTLQYNVVYNMCGCSHYKIRCVHKFDPWPESVVIMTGRKSSSNVASQVK